jgi:hypothetical protein
VVGGGGDGIGFALQIDGNVFDLCESRVLWSYSLMKISEEICPQLMELALLCESRVLWSYSRARLRACVRVFVRARARVRKPPALNYPGTLHII